MCVVQFLTSVAAINLDKHSALGPLFPQVLGKFARGQADRTSASATRILTILDHQSFDILRGRPRAL